MSFVAIGDIGVVGGMIHLGDEAMFEEFVLQARIRGNTDVIGISSNPADSSIRYGIEAISPLGFAFTGPDARSRMQHRMSQVIATAAGSTGLLAADDTAHAVIDAIRSSDGVAITGGGNLASNWPLHIFERATIGAIAGRFAKPLVISGQTLGPVLTEEDRQMLAPLLASASLLSVRETASRALAGQLGVSALATIDDASFLGTAATSGNYALVTFSTHTGTVPRAEFAARAAELLDGLDPLLEIVFLPHFGSLDPDVIAGDSAVHELVIALLSRPARAVPPTDAAAAAALAKGAALVITSRYHPAVFAVSAGVPTIGISFDEYTGVKLTGALGNLGQHSVLRSEELMAGRGEDLARSVWEGRDDIRSAGLELAATRRVESAAWWDRVAATLS